MCITNKKPITHNMHEVVCRTIWLIVTVQKFLKEFYYRSYVSLSLRKFVLVVTYEFLVVLDNNMIIVTK